MTDLTRSLSRAARRLRRAPGFGAAAVLTLTLGIGATASVFTAVRSVLLRPLPYPEADRLVLLSGEMRRDGVQDWPIGLLDVRALADADVGLQGPAAYTGPRSFNLAQGEMVAHVQAEMVSASYFPVLGLTPALGRPFVAAEDRDGAAVVVLGHALWRDRFGADPAAVGGTLRLNDRAYEVIGVMPPGFRGLTDEADLWLPVGHAGIVYHPGYTTVRPFRWIAAVARLEPGRSLPDAAGAVDRTMAGLAERFPDDNGGFGITLEPMRDAYFGDLAMPLLLLSLTAGLVLLIACVNIANLMLARMLDRSRELAMQRALGAPPSAIASWWGAEAALIAAAGGAAGLGLAVVATTVFVRSGAAELPGFAVPRVDLAVVGVAAAASALAAAAAVGIAALLSRGVAPMTVLRAAGRSGEDHARGRSRSWLIAGQSATAMVLLVQALLVTGAFVRLMRAELGFRPDDVLSMRLDLNEQRFADDGAYLALARDLVARGRAVPGVEAVVLQGPGLPGSGSFGAHFIPDGGDPRKFTMAVRNHVTPGFFDALGIPLLAGRDFGDRDGAESDRVIVVSRALAAAMWPGEDAVGQLMRVAQNPAQVYRVIGVVDDVRFQGRSRTERMGPDVYLALFQAPARNPALLNILARTSGRGPAVAGPLAATLQEAAPGLPLFEVMELEALFRRQTASSRMITAIMLAFAALAIVLTAVGVFGMTAYATRRARREIAIRRAVGGREIDVLRLVLQRAATPVAAGAIIGAVGAPALAGVMAARLEDTGTPDAALLSAAALGLLGVATLAALVPALRALRQEPARVLTSD